MKLPVSDHHHSLPISVRLVLYFILIFLITTVTISYFIYNHFSASFKNEIMEYNNRVLNQLTVFSDDLILNNVNELVISLAMPNTSDFDIDSFVSDSEDFNADKWKTILDIRYKLQNLILRNRDIVDSIFIYSKKQNFIVSQNILKSINEKEAAASDEFSWISSMSDSGKSMLWIRTHRTILHSNESDTKGDVITAVCTYPLYSSPANAQAYIAVNVKESSLNNYLVKFNSSNLGQLIIIDNTGAVISHSNKSELYTDISKEYFVKRILLDDSPANFTCDYNNTKYVVSCRKSAYNNWYYVSLVPTSLFYQKDYHIRTRIFIVMITILFAILVLSVILSYKIYSPFKKLLKKYSPAANTSQSTDIYSKNYPYEYRLLDNILSDMSNRIFSLQEVMTKNMLMIKRNFFNDLLYSRSPYEKNIQEMLPYLGIKFQMKYFSVTVFTITGTSISTNQLINIQLVRYNIINYIRDISENAFFCIPIDTNSTTISVITNTASEDYGIIRQFINEVEDFCFKNFSFYMTAGIGQFADNLISVSKSHTEARMALQYKFLYPDRNVYYYYELAPQIDNTASIPEEFGNKLDKCLNLADYDGISNLIENFYEYIVTNNISYPAAKKETAKYAGILVHYIENMGIDTKEVADFSIDSRLIHSESIIDFKNTFLLVVKNAVEYISSRKTNKNSELVSAVENYILNNIQLDLSLNSVSDAFHISTQYLSRIFKEEKGINYIDYVSVCKIEKAKKLLMSTDLGVSEVTQKIGYSHATYFARKFKELTGMTPSDYRRENSKGLHDD